MPPRVVAVAFSGGRDSTALLHATARAGAALGIDVVALYVHHGLHPRADAWQAHCRTLCARWARRGLPLRFDAARLEGAPAAGSSVEAWARIGRYRALGQLARAHGASLVLLGQHRRDQAETFVLQALRGGAPAGLAGMPASAFRDGLTWARPWLRQPREAIEAYLRRHRLRYVDDASNADTRFARNRLRASVWPALTAAFEQAEASLAAAAATAMQAKQLADEVAAVDLPPLLDDVGTALDVGRWRSLTPARRGNALLAWLRRVGAASASLVERLAAELPRAAGTARWPVDRDRELRLYRGWLRMHATAPHAGNAARTPTLAIPGPGSFELPGWGGRLVVRPTRSGGVAVPRLAALRVAARSGGERFQAAPGALPRSLKKQFQAAGVAPWQREGPLFFDGEQLVFVPGLGIDARVRAADGDVQVALRWKADAKP